MGGPSTELSLTVDGLLRARYSGRVSTTTWRRLRAIAAEVGLAGRVVATLTDDQAATLALAYREAAARASLARLRPQRQGTVRLRTWDELISHLRRPGNGRAGRR